MPDKLTPKEKRDLETDEAVKRLFTRWMITICRSSTIAVLVLATQTGSWMVSHSERVMKAMSVLFGGEK